jgi:hypothetical protein
MWTADEEFVDLPASAKVLALWSITSKHTNAAGVVEITKRTMRNETGLHAEDVEHSLAELERFGFAFYEDGVLWVRTRARRIAEHGDNMVKAIVNDLKLVESGHPIRERFIAYYSEHPKLGPVLPTPSRTPLKGVLSPSEPPSTIDGSSKANSQPPSDPLARGSTTKLSGSDNEITLKVNQILARLDECEKWSCPPESDRPLVERTVYDTPAADHLAAATSAVAKGNDPTWRTRTPGQTFKYAVKQQLEHANPAEPETARSDRSKYDRKLGKAA